MTLEQAQIFFYISIPICLILITATMIIGRLVVYGKANKILNKIISAIEEVENKVKLFKTIIEELKNKFMDLQFYAEKAEEFTDHINKIKNGIKETFDENEEEEEDVVRKSRTKTKKTKTKKKSSK